MASMNSKNASSNKNLLVYKGMRVYEKYIVKECLKYVNIYFADMIILTEKFCIQRFL